MIMVPMIGEENKNDYQDHNLPRNLRDSENQDHGMIKLGDLKKHVCQYQGLEIGI